MQFKIKHATSLFLLCATLVACNKTDVQRDPDPQGKTPIELSIGGVDAVGSVTKAVITTDPYNPHDYFDQTNATKVFMIMKSTYGTADYEGSHEAKYTVARGDVAANTNKVNFDTNNQRYWDDAHARSSQLNIWAYAQIGMSTWNQCTFEKDAAGGGYEAETWTTTGSYGWRTAPVYPFIATWKASRWEDDHQEASSVMCQDLIFSNNLVDNSASGTNLGGSDNALKFNFTTRKFPQEGEAVMKFYRAMSKITIKIIEGDGFNKSVITDFQFTPNTSNVKLTGFNTKGLFSIQQGVFQEISQQNVIPSIYLKTTNTSADPYYTLEALALPNIDDIKQSWSTPLHDDYSRFVSGKKNPATDVMMEFIIDNNKYQITSGQLYDALHVGGDPANALVDNATQKTNNGTYIPMEAGKNYVFTFTVGKQKINNITAQVADWKNVTAEDITPSNAYIHLSLKTDEGSAVNSSDPQVDLYRAADPETYTGGDNYNDWAKYGWETGYTATGAKATLGQTATATVYNATDATSTEQWYWPDNNTYYHFRTINKGLTVTSGTNDVISIYSGPINDTYHAINISTAFADGKYNDYIWGAPFKSTAPAATVYSSTTGFCNNANKADGQLYKGIGSTKDNILLIEHHMMSNIYVDLETTDGSAHDEVVLTGAIVKLVRYAKEAKLQMGNGLVTSYSNYDNGTGTLMTVDAHAEGGGIPAYDYSYRVVPQSLTNTSKGEGTKVGVVITTTDGNVYIVDDLSAIKEKSSETLITDWFPGKKYFYKFVLKKTGITKLEATIVDWENVEASEEEITIK